MRKILLLSVLMAAVAAAQTQVRVVRASGEASISVKPDLARLTVGVVTRANTAQEAGTQNASQTEAMLTALKQVLGVNADIKTVGYSLNPNYNYPQGQPPQLAGYTATNTLQVTTPDLGNVGPLIDAATQAGANTVGGLQFTLKDPEPVRAQALAAAAKQARAHAEAIASGLGVQLGQVVSASEGSAVRVVSTLDATAAARTTTPIETGMVEVTATVSIEIQITS